MLKSSIQYHFLCMSSTNILLNFFCAHWKSFDYDTLSFSCTGKLSHYHSGTRTAILHHCNCFAALFFIFLVCQAQAAELLKSLAINLSLFDCWDFITLQLTLTALQLTATATSASSIRLGDVYQRCMHRCSKVVSVLTCSSEPKCRYGCISLIPPSPRYKTCF